MCLAHRVSVCDQLRAACQAICLRSLLQLSSPAEESDAPQQLLALKSQRESAVTQIMTRAGPVIIGEGGETNVNGDGISRYLLKFEY